MGDFSDFQRGQIVDARLTGASVTSVYHKYVRLKMDGLLEPWQTLKYEVCCDFCV